MLMVERNTGVSAIWIVEWKTMVSATRSYHIMAICNMAYYIYGHITYMSDISHYGNMPYGLLHIWPYHIWQYAIWPYYRWQYAIWPHHIRQYGHITLTLVFYSTISPSKPPCVIIGLASRLIN
jgi:hypothetical protein